MSDDDLADVMVRVFTERKGSWTVCMRGALDVAESEIRIRVLDEVADRLGKRPVYAEAQRKVRALRDEAMSSAHRYILDARHQGGH